VTTVDLPGTMKEDVSVEVTDGHLVLSGERKRDSEEKKKGFYRSEREYGSFYRAVALPEGVKVEDVKETFSDSVLEVSTPLPARPEAKEGFGGTVMGVVSMNDILLAAGARRPVQAAEVVDTLRAICAHHRPSPHIAAA
jgi:hypothetical protein